MSAISAVHSQAIFHRPSTQQTQHSNQGNADKVPNPAQSAKTALTDRADLASKPLGSLVSLFAKGLPLPPFENASEPAEQESMDDTGNSIVAGS